MADAKEETPNGQTAYHAGQQTKEENAAEPMSAFNADAMDGERRCRLADGASTKNITCGISFCVKEERNALTEIVRTGHRRQRSAKPMPEFNSDAIDKERAR